MGERENRIYAAKQYLDMAKTSLNEYETLRDNDFQRGGMSRLYFAAYQAVYAMLISIGEKPKTYQGASNLFYQHFVDQGTVSKELNSGFSKLQMYRGWSDYEFSRSISEEELDKGAEVTTRLIQFCEEWLKDASN